MSEPNYHTKKFFSESLLAIEAKVTDTHEQAYLFRYKNAKNQLNTRKVY